MAWGGDMAEGTLPLRTVLFKVTAGSTLETMPVIDNPGMTKSSSRRGRLRGGGAGGRAWSRDRVGLSQD